MTDSILVAPFTFSDHRYRAVIFRPESGTSIVAIEYFDGHDALGVERWRGQSLCRVFDSGPEAAAELAEAAMVAIAEESKAVFRALAQDFRSMAESCTSTPSRAPGLVLAAARLERLVGPEA